MPPNTDQPRPQLPGRVRLFQETNEGFTVRRRDDEVLIDLVVAFSQLLEYVKAQEKTDA